VAKVHRLILDHGKDAALRFDVDRTVVEAAVGYMSSEDQEPVCWLLPNLFRLRFAFCGMRFSHEGHTAGIIVHCERSRFCSHGSNICPHTLSRDTPMGSRGGQRHCPNPRRSGLYLRKHTYIALCLYGRLGNYSGLIVGFPRAGES
jgi:hypothetical protein